ncbi:MAG: hypothetical protein WC405_09030 [Syntrophales bacterium]
MQQNPKPDPQGELKDKIDYYLQTVHALVGFMHLFRFDQSQMSVNTDVTTFQGWRLEPSDKKKKKNNGEEVKFVTPDLGIVYEGNKGILAEAKASFPRNTEYWKKPFEQLMSYDDDLKGWPTESGHVKNHDIVLLVNQERCSQIVRYYKGISEKEIKIERPFIIVQFNRSDGRRQYYFFQKQFGDLSNEGVNVRLDDGEKLPMDLFVAYYAKIKLYDSEPPIPYLIQLIWENVVLQHVLDNPKFPYLRKRQRLEVILQLNDILAELSSGYTFHSLHADTPGRKPQIPQKSWIVKACDCLVKYKEAEWIDGKDTIKIYFQRYDSVLDHFIACCAEEVEDKQLNLFDAIQN